ncbi:short chain dehydrogenase reductase [Chaetomium fimeti]|uniref:Short chain dehydrogenase reductase n=1 Tax=Chaetomium fimeti TaxID=1854472 RepID=A0AAE0H834_9PEZI|nr:short chain dehydrogenase reductase [Chaetomium fimeti]
MSARIHTILIIGAGGGIGEAVARRFHGLGKKIIVTGREEDREYLTQLARDLPGVGFRVWDVTHLDKLQSEVKRILTAFPKLDTVFINAGTQSYYDIFQQPTADAEVIRELTTNLTAPILISQAFASHLFDLAQSGVKTNLFLTSSSLAYFPVPFYPAYCPSKAGIASFTKILRMQLDSTGNKNMNVVEVVPPYVDTPLNAAHRVQTDALQGGEDKAVQPMPLGEYIDKFFTALEQTKPDGSLSDEVGVGFGAQGAAIWHESNRKLLSASGMAD